MSEIYRVENDVSGDYIATSLEEALRFIRDECAESLSDLEGSVRISTEEMADEDIEALPEWP